MRPLFLASVAVLFAFDAPRALPLGDASRVQPPARIWLAGNTSSNTSSNSSCNSSNGRTVCLRTYDRTVVRSQGDGRRGVRRTTRIERFAPPRHSRERAWRFDDDD